ncbi:tetratricopeptide repeat domain protein [Synechococcus sp. PCC 7335]|uniref:CHAT domain-containing tetratricopeptide repeat protein n=1 Tax=Synechococcus sp. (strain ATCC 29403 / PCC 7335) TaxID=91464 RepID=UPI00017EC3D0|nr:CHAT domain-containing protein [Synechococcus sp. PCC 7335]EDX85945.1 tetratricopeptide repeat domain protein [Synechococcus sp. PCC 7335]
MSNQKLVFLFAASLTLALCATPVAAELSDPSKGSSTVSAALISQSHGGVNAQFQAGEDALALGQYEASIQSWEAALAAYRASGDQEKEAVVLNRIALAHSYLRQYPEAIRRHEESLTIARRLNQQEEIANALDGIGITYAFQNKPVEALATLEESLSINRSIANHQGEADNLDHLGSLQVTQDNLSEALSYYTQSLALSQDIDYKIGQARSLGNIGYVQYQREDYTQALDTYQRELAIRESLGNPVTVFTATKRVGAAYSQLERYEEAIESYEKGLAIAKSLNDSDKELDILWLMGDTSKSANRYEDAITYYTWGLNKAKRLGDKPLEADFNLSIGNIQAALGKHNGAIDSYLQSLSIYREIDRKSSEAIALRNIGLSSESLEKYQEAIDYYQQSLAIEKTLGNREEQALSLEYIGVAYRALEDYSAALDYFEQSLAIARALADLHSAERLHRRMGFTYNTIQNYEKATDAYQQSLDLNQRLSDPVHESYVLMLLGISYGDRGAYDQALRYYRQSADLKDNAGKRDLLYSVNNTLKQARGTYQEQTEVDISAIISAHEDALFLHNSAEVDIKAEEDSYFIDNLENITNRLFQLNWNKGDIDRAVYYLEQLSTLREEETSDLLYSFGQVETLLRLDLAISANQTNAAITAHLNKLPENDTAARLSLLNILRRKGRVLDGLVLHSARGTSDAETETDLATLAEIKEINTQLANLYYEAAASGQTDAYEEDKRTLESRLTNLNVSLSRIENNSAQAQAVAQMKVSSIDAVRRLIPTDAALIELVSYQPYHLEGFLRRDQDPVRYAAYILTRSGTIQAVDLGERAAIDQQVAKYRQALRTQSSQLQTISRELDETLMAPIRPLLGEKTHLLISPDGQLNVMPFDALIDEQDRYLIESYQISYLTSGRDLLKLQSSTASAHSSVIIANPDYAGAVNSTTEASIANTATTQSVNQRSADVEGLSFSALPGTAEEANAIAPLLPNPTILTQRQATESRLKQLVAPSILHIATHGFFLPDTTYDATSDADSRGKLGASLEVVDTELEAALIPNDYEIENPLLRSGLALAGVNARRSGGGNLTEDGVFTALEASNLNLEGTQLVVLSACETGLGATSDGDGVHGLRRAFAIAGAESQLMSLWQVDDYGTSELMQVYYENLINEGQGRSEALRNAQLALMSTGTYAHPYYWSSFIFSGDWRPIE